MARILLIEDDPNLRSTYTRLLKQLGYDVVSAVTLEGAQQFLDESVDLVLTDINLDDGNSADFHDRNHELLERQHIGFLVMTGNLGQPAVSYFNNHGVKVLAKPVDFSELVHAIKQAIRQKKT